MSRENLFLGEPASSAVKTSLELEKTQESAVEVGEDVLKSPESGMKGSCRTRIVCHLLVQRSDCVCRNYLFEHRQENLGRPT